LTGTSGTLRRTINGTLNVTGPAQTGCANAPVTATVNVSMQEYRFVLNGSASLSVPGGCIRFNIKNDGQVQHNFSLIGIKAGTILPPGGTETWVVQLTAGTKNYTCDVPFHDSFGMNGRLTVT
jgi:uncharacterized cupredoxin-like copper-binding protein